MSACKSCRGLGYVEGVDCPECGGIGSVNWWETKEYKRTGKIPKEKGDTDKAFTGLGLIGGAIIGIGIYLVTANSILAIIVGIICAALAETILRFIFKYFLILFVIGYVIYLIFF